MDNWDDYLSANDKPFVENINDAILLANVFDLTVPIELPLMFNTGAWDLTTNAKQKASVAVIQTLDATGITAGGNNTLTGTGTLKFAFYPNFNQYGGITKVEWTTSSGTITIDIYDSTGTLIKSNIPNGNIGTISSVIRDLQNFEFRVHFDGATLTQLKITMQNNDETRYGAEVGISNVNGLENRLTLIESKNTEQDTAINGKAPTDHSSTGTGYGKATTTRYGHVIVDSALDGSSTNPVQNNVVNTALNGKASSTHTHGNISNDGKIGSTSGKVITTGSSGILKASNNIPQSSVDGLTTALDGKVNSSDIHKNDTGWTNGTFNGNTYTGAFKGMIRNGFATINLNLKFNVNSGTQFAVGYFPLKFKPAGNEVIEFAVKRYGDGDGEKASSVQISVMNNNVYFIVYTGENIKSSSGFVGAVTYPIDDY